MEIKDNIDVNKHDFEGIITKDAIAMIKGIEKLDLEQLEFHDAEILRFSINYPKDGDSFIDVDMQLLWGRYSRLTLHLEGIISYEIDDSGSRRYLYGVGFATDYDDLVTYFDSLGQVKCQRAEITDVEEFENGISPAQARMNEYNQTGKEDIS